MRPLEEQLADTFRRARWRENDGRPICPFCYDDGDLTPGYTMSAVNPQVRRYHCRCCRRQFSDIHATPLERTQAPLRAWAAVLLAQVQRDSRESYSYRALARELGMQNTPIRTMARRLHGTTLAARWAEELAVLGITIDSILTGGPTHATRRRRCD